MKDERWLREVLKSGLDLQIKRALVELFPLISRGQVWVGDVGELERDHECSSEDLVIVVPRDPSKR